MRDAVNQQSTTLRTYWVVGGEYETMTFERLVQGTGVIFGPFGCCEDAQSVWRDVSDKTRSRATVRFTIVCEPNGASP
jgi:hypothetical protein